MDNINFNCLIYSQNQQKYYLTLAIFIWLVFSKEYIILEKIINIHGYHKDYHKLIEFNTNTNFKTTDIHALFKEKLLKRQNNLITINNDEGKTIKFNYPDINKVFKPQHIDFKNSSYFINFLKIIYRSQENLTRSLHYILTLFIQYINSLY